MTSIPQSGPEQEDPLFYRVWKIVDQDREVQRMQGVRGVSWNPDFLPEQIMELIEQILQRKVCIQCGGKHYAKGLCQRCYKKTDEYKAYQKAYMKAYQKTDKRKAYMKAWYQKNRDRILAQQKQRSSAA